MTELVERFRAGDADAVREIYRTYGGPIMTVARSIVRDPELAAEVVQATFTKAWRAADTFHGGAELAPWLYSIARRTAIDALRAEALPTRGGHAPEVEVADESTTFEQTWETFEVRRAIDGLPPDEREVVRRSHLLGETHRQIADVMGIPVGTVKSRSGRAHRRLAEALPHLRANRTPPTDVEGGGTSR